MTRSSRIAALAGASLLTSLGLAAVSHAADDCGPGMYFNLELNSCVLSPAVGPVGPVGPGPVGPGPVGPGPVGPGPVGPGPVGPGPVGPR